MKQENILKVILSVSILLYLFAMLTAFLILSSDIVKEVIAKTIKTTVTVAQNEDKIVQMHTRVLPNECNTCIKLCEGRQRCKETCFALICNK